MLSVLDISSECEIGPFSGSIRNVVGGEEMEEVRRQKGPPPKRRERGNKIGGGERDLMEIIRTKQES